MALAVDISQQVLRNSVIAGTRFAHPIADAACIDARSSHDLRTGRSSHILAADSCTSIVISIFIIDSHLLPAFGSAAMPASGQGLALVLQPSQLSFDASKNEFQFKVGVQATTSDDLHPQPRGSITAQCAAFVKPHTRSLAGKASLFKHFYLEDPYVEGSAAVTAGERLPDPTALHALAHGLADANRAVPSLSPASQCLLRIATVCMVLKPAPGSRKCCKPGISLAKHCLLMSVSPLPSAGVRVSSRKGDAPVGLVLSARKTLNLEDLEPYVEEPRRDKGAAHRPQLKLDAKAAVTLEPLALTAQPTASARVRDAVQWLVVQRCARWQQEELHAARLGPLQAS